MILMDFPNELLLRSLRTVNGLVERNLTDVATLREQFTNSYPRIPAPKAGVVLPADASVQVEIDAMDSSSADAAGASSTVGKIHIGYLTSTQRGSSIMARITNGIYQHHDFSKYDVTIFDLSDASWTDTMSDIHRLLAVTNGTVRWESCYKKPADEIARLISSKNVHVLVEVNGLVLEPTQQVMLYRPGNMHRPSGCIKAIPHLHGRPRSCQSLIDVARLFLLLYDMCSADHRLLPRVDSYLRPASCPHARTLRRSGRDAGSSCSVSCFIVHGNTAVSATRCHRFRA